MKRLTADVQISISRSGMSRVSEKDHLTGWAPVFAALGDPTRLSLLNHLSRHGSSSIATLTAGSSITRQAITKHLHVLEAAGLIHGSKRGREQVWEVDSRNLKMARKCIDHISSGSTSALLRLGQHLQEEASRR
jgi:DNA-binding transcriptional ArsR family regulator